MMTPVGQRSTQRAQRVQTSSSTTKNDVVFGVVAGLVGVDGFVDGGGGEHVDAFPRADVDAAFAEDAFGLVDVEELLGFDRLR